MMSALFLPSSPPSVPLPPHSGTQHGDLLLLPRGGIAAAAKGGTVEWGSHFFEVRVRVPDGGHMDEQQRGIVEALSGLLRDRHGGGGGREEGAALERWW